MTNPNDLEFDEKELKQAANHATTSSSSFIQGARYQNSIDKAKHNKIIDSNFQKIIELENDREILTKENNTLKESNALLQSCYIHSDDNYYWTTKAYEEFKSMKEKLSKAVKTIIELKDSGDFRYDEVEKSENVLKELGEL